MFHENVQTKSMNAICPNNVKPLLWFSRSKAFLFHEKTSTCEIHLQLFLAPPLRRYSNPVVLQKKLSKVDAPKATKSKSDAEVFNRVTDYLESNLNTHVTIDQICKDNLIGRSQLQKIFKEHCDLGIIEYFSMLKINAAKELIRTKQLNFTQVAEHLGYTSIHYFSRQFKKVSGMTPSEYASSIKAMAEGKFK